MRNVLFDTNIILDVLLERKGLAEVSGLALSFVDRGNAVGFVSAHAIPTIYYVAHKSEGARAACQKTEDLCAHLQVAAVNAQVIQKAFACSIADFEDALTHAAAEIAKCELIVTRNVKHFSKGSIQPVLPDIFLQLMGL